jgi:CubicO group peptidase (beta-lactamase class C family)
MDSTQTAISRRRLLSTLAPAFVGSVVVGACSSEDRRSADSSVGSVGPTPSTGTTPATAATPAPTTVSVVEVPPTAPSTAPEATAALESSTSAAGQLWSSADFAALDDLIATTNGEAFIIVERGATIHEWYRTDATYARDIASAQKSILSMLVGRAIADGHFALDATIDELLGSDWTEHGESTAITVRHLLTMTSGLDDKLDVVAPPGTTWIYSDAFATLFSVLTVTTGRELNDIAREWLFDPAGASTAEFYERPGRRFAPNGLRATVADLVAIGQVVLDDTHPSHSASWLAESFVPSQESNLAYGYLWWLNGQESFLLPGPIRTPTPGALIPTAPPDLVAALGKDDQKLFVSRDLDLVVARLGDNAGPGSRAGSTSFDAELWTILLELRG